MLRKPGEGNPEASLSRAGPALESLHVERSDVRCGTGYTQISASRRPRSAPENLGLTFLQCFLCSNTTRSLRWLATSMTRPSGAP
jgi:hypothetical protein